MAKVVHTCTGCVPIDASIIDTYVALVKTNEFVEAKEDERIASETERETAEAARIASENARIAAEQVRSADYAVDHAAAVSDHATAVADHANAESDHATAVEDHATTEEAASRAEAAAAAAEHMVDIKTGPPGPQGNTGSSVDYPYELVNNLTTDDPTKGLSAEMGVELALLIESSMPRAVKNALYTLARNMAFVNDEGYTNELDQLRVWAESIALVSISAVFTQGTAEIYDTDSLNKLKRYLVVTAAYDDSSTVVLNDSDYSLSGTLAIGTSTVTVTYQGKTDTFSVVVTASPYLYILQSPFTSSGSNSIDTGFRPEKGKTYTILCESQESTSSSTPVFIFGNRLTTSSSYQGWTSQNGRVWGLSLLNANQINVGNNTLRVASVFTASADDGAMVGITLRYRIGSGAISQSTSEHYGPDMTAVSSTSNFFLGAQYYGTQGFLGVINSFVIFDGEMPLADITDFLTNGM